MCVSYMYMYVCGGGSKLKAAGQISGIAYEGNSGLEHTLIWSPFIPYKTANFAELYICTHSTLPTVFSKALLCFSSAGC